MTSRLRSAVPEDHPACGCVCKYQEALPPPHNLGKATCFWKSASGLDIPDVQTGQVKFPLSSAENAARFGLPERGWTLCGSVSRPKGRGQLGLTGLLGWKTLDPIEIEDDFLARRAHLQATTACVELCRDPCRWWMASCTSMDSSTCGWPMARSCYG
jgi:choline dehydrogenase